MRTGLAERRGRLSHGALNWGNEGNRQRLMDGQHWNEAKVQAIRFLVHMIGDIHQPLHAADDEDLGANLKFVLRQC